MPWLTLLLSRESQDQETSESYSTLSAGRELKRYYTQLKSSKTAIDKSAASVPTGVVLQRSLSVTEQRFEARDEETNSEYLYSLTSAISESEIGLVVASSRLSRSSGVLSVSVGRRQLAIR